MCWNKTAKKLNDPLTRILVRGLFNFVDLVEKRNQTNISPKLLHIYFFTVNLDPDLAVLD